MKKLMFVLVLLPALAWGQAATPTPAVQGKHGESTVQAYWKAQVVLVPTVVPTAFSTPQLLNSQPIKYLDVLNQSNCDVVVSLDGGTAENVTVPAGKPWSPPLAEMGMHHSGNVKIRANSACTSGNVSITGAY
jgi:hypothetical protein